MLMLLKYVYVGLKRDYLINYRTINSWLYGFYLMLFIICIGLVKKQVKRERKLKKLDF